MKLATIAYYFFRAAPLWVRLLVFVMIFGGVTTFGYQTFKVEAPTDIVGQVIPTSESADPAATAEAIRDAPTGGPSSAAGGLVVTGGLFSVRADAPSPPSPSSEAEPIECPDAWTRWSHEKTPGDPCPEGCRAGELLDRTVRMDRLKGILPVPGLKFRTLVRCEPVAPA